uniref:Bm14770 n=2 Tax=Brugia TaxID=6278 RepID=A0A1I9G5D7_BRUMA|nr:Bm14770 [Brugia malayi]
MKNEKQSLLELSHLIASNELHDDGFVTNVEGTGNGDHQRRRKNNSRKNFSKTQIFWSRGHYKYYKQQEF